MSILNKLNRSFVALIYNRRSSSTILDIQTTANRYQLTVSTAQGVQLLFMHVEYTHVPPIQGAVPA